MSKPSPLPSLPDDRMPRAAHPTIEDVCSPESMRAAYKQAMRGRRRNRSDAVRFNKQKVTNMNGLRDEMLDGEYTPGEYMRFTIRDKKEREIDAPFVRDNIAQAMLHPHLQAATMPRLVDTTFACLPDRGNLVAALEIQRAMKLARLEYGPDCAILKMDVYHCFFMVDREIMKKMFGRYIDEPVLFGTVCRVIDAAPMMEVEGKGAPLGNPTSQDGVNLYLSPIDNCAKRFLGVKYYFRYMDDIVAILPTKERAVEVKDHLVKLAREKLLLQFNEKTQVFPLKQGVSALGFKIRCESLVMSDRSKKAEKRRLKKQNEKLEAGLLTEKEIQQQASSFLGHARWGNNYNICKKLFEKYPYLKFEDPNFRFGDRKQQKRMLMKRKKSHK